MPDIPDIPMDNDISSTEIEAPGGTQTTHAYEGAAGVAGAGATDTELTSQQNARGRVADRVDRVGDALERRALELELKGGLKAKAAPAVRRVSRVADASAAYVRERDVADMRSDLEDSIREHPLRSIAIALGAGYILARILD